MGVKIETETQLSLECTAGNKCNYRESGPNDFGGSVYGDFRGPDVADVIRQAKERGWIVDGDSAICPECAPPPTPPHREKEDELA